MAASYHIDPFLYSLDKLQTDLTERDLIPSRKPLLEDLGKKFKALKREGIHNLGDLISCLKNKRKLDELSSRTGIDADYLNLLRREANSYLPNPVPLARFGGFPDRVITNLGLHGIKNSRHLFERLNTDHDLEDFAETVNIPEAVLRELLGLADLVRAYGVGPVFARILYETGIQSIAEFRQYSPQEVIELYQEQTGKQADFSISDIKFCLDLIQALDLGRVR